MKIPGLLAVITIMFISTTAYTQTQTVNIKVAGVTRNYVLHVPSGVTGNPALVVMLHGHGMDANSQESGSKWFPMADKEKFLVAYPNAINQNWDVSGTGSDMTFILAMIDTIDAKYHIDRDRVYCAGFSQGAAMCHTCGCAHSEVFAAISPASGSLGGSCTLKRPVPVLMSFGTGGDIATPASFMTSVTKWAQLDSCPLTPKIIRPYPLTNPKSVETRIIFGPGKDGAFVIADSAHGRGHEWPMDSVNAENKTVESWAFFKQFTLKGAVTAVSRYEHHQVADFPGLKAIYSPGQIRLVGVGENVPVRVTDTRGRIVAFGNSAYGRFEFANKPSGLYIVNIKNKGASSAVRMMVP